jgi:hypothetical protein
MPTFSQQAHAFFPKMPEQLFSLWLDERIEANGWPPTTARWQQVLCFKSLRFWQGLNWKKGELDLAQAQLGRCVERIINSLESKITPSERSRFLIS